MNFWKTWAICSKSICTEVTEDFFTLDSDSIKSLSQCHTGVCCICKKCESKVLHVRNWLFICKTVKALTARIVASWNSEVALRVSFWKPGVVSELATGGRWIEPCAILYGWMTMKKNLLLLLMLMMRMILFWYCSDINRFVFMPTIITLSPRTQKGIMLGVTIIGFSCSFNLVPLQPLLDRGSVEAGRRLNDSWPGTVCFLLWNMDLNIHNFTEDWCSTRNIKYSFQGTISLLGLFEDI